MARERADSGISKEDLLSRLSTLGEVQLKEGTSNLISLLEDVERILDSGELTELERQGFTLIREYLKEAVILGLRGLPRAPLVQRIREVASTLRNIGDLEERGVEVLSLGDLVVVGEVDGRSVYSIKQKRGAD